MRDLTWLRALPADDPAFAPLRRAMEMDPPDVWILARAHRLAVEEAIAGADVDYRADMLHVQSMHACDPDDWAQAQQWHREQVHAIGYALGVTAVHVAVRERAGHLAGMGVAA